jgi:head-tail adaptor
MAKRLGAGDLNDRIVILTGAPVAVSVTSITRVSATATVTTASAHGFTTGDFVVHAGATQTEYNGEVKVTVTGPTTYTFTVSGTPASPATGTITATYKSNSQGGNEWGFSTLATVWANVEPLSANEQLASGGITAIGRYAATIYYRADVLPTMRCQWRRYGQTAAQTYEIHSVQPADGLDGRRLLRMEIGVVEG